MFQSNTAPSSVRHDTNSGALAWATYTLLPGAWDTAAAEVARVLSGRTPTAADLPALTYLNGIVHETLRLTHPGSSRAAG
ncbi:Putative cytochrome P450 139 [Mycobacterium simulans]|nr:Putative cytochrome P450 139 [Mycobacterium simulans]